MDLVGTDSRLLRKRAPMYRGILYAIVILSTGLAILSSNSDRKNISARQLSCTSAEHQRQRDILMEFYGATGGSSWDNNNGWGSDCDYCNWSGVSCNQDSLVTGLTFFDNGLTGNLPGSLFDLKELRNVFILTSNLSGEIPEAIGRAHNLSQLVISDAQLSGNLPDSLYTLSNLTRLNLTGNSIEGEISTSIGNLTSLRELFLLENNLTGSVPSEIGLLENLVEVNLSFNNLSGAIPSEISGCQSLEILSLNNNELTGPLPVEMFALPALRNLFLYQNQINGVLPDFGNINNSLQAFWISDNKLVGSLPNSIGNLRGLRTLLMDNNGLAGELPSSIGNLADLRSLSINNNRLSGLLPIEIGQLGQLRSLSLAHNEISGSLPSELGDLSELLALSLESNSITGSIPESIINLTSINSIYLRENELEGEIPFGMSQLGALNSLQLEDNQLSGELPGDFFDINATSLNVARNHLIGCYPGDKNNACSKNWILTGNCFNLSFEDYCQGSDCNDFQEIIQIRASSESLCQGERIRLFAIRKEAGDFRWSTGAINQPSITVSPEETTTYFLEQTDNCLFVDSITIEVIPSIETYLVEEICFGESYEVGGVEFNRTGTFTRRLNGVSCDSTVYLDLTVLPEVKTDLVEEICSGDQFIFGEDTISVSGLYSRTISTLHCDSTIYLNLDVTPPLETYLVEEVCFGEIYEIEGDQLSESGRYTYQLSGVECDSTVVLDLVVLSENTMVISETICAGSSYNLGDVTYTETGSFIYTSTDQSGCDSTVILDLVVLDMDTIYLSAEICAGDTYEIGNESFNASGRYEVELENNEGCTSIAAVTLDVVFSSSSMEVVEKCRSGGYEWQGQTYLQSGIYENIIPNSQGCDSIMTLDLTLLPSTQERRIDFYCQGQELIVDEDTITTTGAYYYTYRNQYGCDSTIIYEVRFEVVNNEEVYLEGCPGEILIYDGREYVESGAYQLYNTHGRCDDTTFIYVDLSQDTTFQYEEICFGNSFNFNGIEYTETGVYSFVSGDQACPDITILDLYVAALDTIKNNFTVCPGDSILVNGNYIKQDQDIATMVVDEDGCAYIEYTSVEVFPEKRLEINYNICSNENFMFNGRMINESGIYPFIFTASDGCDSLVVATVNVEQAPEITHTVDLCEGDMFLVGNEEVTEPGIYQYFKSGLLGCDTLVTLNIQYRQVESTFFEINICAGETDVFAGIDIDGPGEFTEVFTASNGCDSIVNLVVNEIELPVVHESYLICEGETVSINGQIVEESGVYEFRMKPDFGCDTLVVAEVNIVPSIAHQYRVNICPGDSVLIGGSYRKQDGVFRDTFVSSSGCDSIDIIELNLLQSGVSEVIDAIICEGESYEIQGILYSDPGRYQIETSSKEGCLGMIELNLFVFPVAESVQDIVLCNGSVLDLPSQVISTSGNYQEVFQSSRGCDSIVNYSVEVVEEIEPTIQLSGKLCLGQSTSLFIEDSYLEYSWNTGSTDPFIEISLPGVYEVDVIDFNGCEGRAEIKVTEAVIIPDFSIEEEPFPCKGIDGVVNFSPGDYLLSVDNGETWTDDKSITFASGGAYEVLIADLDSTCVQMAYRLELDERSPDWIERVHYVNDTDCLGNNGEIMVFLKETNEDLEFSIDGGKNYQTTSVFNNLEGGKYEVLVKDNQGCVQKWETIELLDTEFPIYALTVLQTPGCIGAEGGIVAVESEDSIHVLWGSGQDTNTLENLQSGWYFVSVTSEAGCLSEDSIYVEEGPDWNLEFGLPDDARICAGDTLWVPFANMGVTPQWSSDQAFLLEGNQIGILEEGVYTLTVRGQNGCYFRDEIMVLTDEKDFSGKDFLIPLEGVKNTPITAANVSWPPSDDYAWIINDPMIEILDTIQNQIILSFKEAGFYTISMKTVVEGCAKIISKDIRIVDEESQLMNEDGFHNQVGVISDFILFPNPNDGRFQIKITSSEISPIHVSIVNSMGDRMITQTLSGKLFYQEEFDISTLPPGPYAMVIQSGVAIQYIIFNKF